MDGSTVEHSDSDSGESWTLLENTPVYADDAPEFPEISRNNERKLEENNEKDEDTDGISIISDSEPDSGTPCDLCYDQPLPEEIHPSEPQIPECNLANNISINKNNEHESIRAEDDFLRVSNGKMKTYVHRRNKRLSTVLNIIVLGSVITAAGVAIGHMWGAKNDCSSIHTSPSVNKILSNLYKLQEENAYLRNKLKELTIFNNIQMQNRKTDLEKLSKQKCRKVFEPSLNSKNADTLTKCVDSEKVLNLLEPKYEKDFLHDIDKLKNIYQQNKSWLDEEISKRLKQEQNYMKQRNNLFKLKSVKENIENENLLNKNSQITDEKIEQDEDIKNNNEDNASQQMPERFTYADSLKNEYQPKKISKRNIKDISNKSKKKLFKKKNNIEHDTLTEKSLSDDEFKKDDRYMGHKYKQERKKHDRQKSYKKQKRRNKYEQWEMKGGYMKDYDDISGTSSQENEFILKTPTNNFANLKFEQSNNHFSDHDEKDLSTDNTQGKGNNNNDKTKQDNDKSVKNWYDKRAILRTEARKKLEKELFGETSPNSAGWYFRRMQKREQCRTKIDNSTHRKLSKRNMNFKMKY